MRRTMSFIFRKDPDKILLKFWSQGLILLLDWKDLNYDRYTRGWKYRSDNVFLPTGDKLADDYNWW